MNNPATTLTRVFATLTLAVLPAIACAEEPAMSKTAPTKEMRMKMAQAHERMAECLRSERTMADCHKEMKHERHDMMQGMMDKQGCKMMEEAAPPAAKPTK